MNKSDLRKIYLQKRQSLPRSQWASKSNSIVEHLKASELVRSSKTILSYCSFRQEPDLSELLTLPKVWGLPRCVDSSLSWHVASDLRSGKFGIQEPDPDSLQIDVSEVDLMLVPCVMCDRRGYRLGYGGGFYDRLFSQPEWQEKTAIGILFDFALVDEFSIDPWDQPLSMICTESGFI
ncbi:MAG: 5-formyltetrahydrofolate cyclo-ligase [Leptolyngbya sp. Prado105]|jgi:5-formyltetrahydrofolate cyclo-ligase|nr:5-formyltetrahydrofolate cyclo-ligase [Leptolyngbya sp. Prado105]